MKPFKPAPVRKLFSVEMVREFVNDHLQSENYSQEEKRGMIIVLDKILMATGNYHNYEYLDNYYLENGEPNPECLKMNRYYHGSK